MKYQAITVSELNSYIKEKIAEDEMPIVMFIITDFFISGHVNSTS